MQSQLVQKKFGIFTATLIGMNAMIGAGIFTSPAKLATAVGPAALLTYLFVIVAVWCMAQSFGRLGELFPGVGSFGNSRAHGLAILLASLLHGHILLV